MRANTGTLRRVMLVGWSVRDMSCFRELKTVTRPATEHKELS